MAQEQFLPTLYWSYRLALCRQVATPDLELIWNPRQGPALCQATSTFLQEINEKLFPVDTDVVDLQDVANLLSVVPIETYGFAAWEEDYDAFADDHVYRLMVILAWVYEYAWDDDAAVDMYWELKSVWGIEQPQPPWAISDWIVEQARDGLLDKEPEGKEHWLNLSWLLRYVTCNTGYGWLDIASEDASSIGAYYWSEEALAELQQHWSEAKVVSDRIDSFVAWVHADKANMARLLQYINRACDDIVSKSGQKWYLAELEEALAEYLAQMGEGENTENDDE